MIRLTQKAKEPLPTTATVTLTMEQRAKSRQRIVLDDGREAGIFLERGETLKDGDCLLSDDDLIVQVQAAPERLSIVVSNDPDRLARACYHLGNRHVPLQIESGRLRYRHDHVLDAMVRGLGLAVTQGYAPFQPEPGAYGGAATIHGHHH